MKRFLARSRLADRISRAATALLFLLLLPIILLAARRPGIDHLSGRSNGSRNSKPT